MSLVIPSYYEHETFSDLGSFLHRRAELVINIFESLATGKIRGYSYVYYFRDVSKWRTAMPYLIAALREGDYQLWYRKIKTTRKETVL